jgi:hypothetical protein
MRLDPAVVEVQAPSGPEAEAPDQAPPAPAESSVASEDVRAAFG